MFLFVGWRGGRYCSHYSSASRIVAFRPSCPWPARCAALGRIADCRHQRRPSSTSVNSSVLFDTATFLPTIRCSRRVTGRHFRVAPVIVMPLPPGLAPREPVFALDGVVFALDSSLGPLRWHGLQWCAPRRRAARCVKGPVTRIRIGRLVNVGRVYLRGHFSSVPWLECVAKRVACTLVQNFLNAGPAATPLAALLRVGMDATAHHVPDDPAARSSTRRLLRDAGTLLAKGSESPLPSLSRCSRARMALRVGSASAAKVMLIDRCRSLPLYLT